MPGPLPEGTAQQLRMPRPLPDTVQLKPSVAWFVKPGRLAKTALPAALLASGVVPCASGTGVAAGGWGGGGMRA